jgi:hypothetical protein
MPIGAECDTPAVTSKLNSAQDRNRLDGIRDGQIPELHRVVVTCRCQPTVLGAESHNPLPGPFMPAQDADRTCPIVGGHIPEAQTFVI